MRLAALLAGLLALAPLAPAQLSRIVVGPSDNIAIDQPRVAVALEDPVTGQNIGPDFANSWLLDTGANGILAAGLAVDEMTDQGYRTEGTFDEEGVGGYRTVDVSAVYNVYFAGTDGAALGIPGARILSDPAADFSGFGGVMGMPAMVGRTVGMDLSAMIAPLSELGFDYINVSFGQGIPAGAGHRYQVPLSLVSYPAGTGVAPTYAPIPFIQAQARNGTHHVNGAFVLDTGAQMSGISSEVAIALGFDSDGDGDLYDETDTFASVTGVNGTVELPVLSLGRVAVMSSGGVELTWTDLEVIVVDVGGIDGIFGMDLLASGWAQPVLDQILLGSTDKTGFVQQVHFDFRDQPALVLDLDASVDHVLHGGDANRDGLVNVGDLGILAAHWRHTGVSWSQGDFNDDTILNVGDLAVLAMAWGQSFPPSTPLPEPTSLLLIGTGLVLLRARRGKRPR